MLTVPPSTTFADLKQLHLIVEVTCQRCGNTQRLDGSWLRIAGRRIAGARYRCDYSWAGGRTCGGIGLPTLKREMQQSISPGRLARGRRNHLIKRRALSWSGPTPTAFIPSANYGRSWAGRTWSVGRAGGLSRWVPGSIDTIPARPPSAARYAAAMARSCSRIRRKKVCSMTRGRTRRAIGWPRSACGQCTSSPQARSASASRRANRGPQISKPHYERAPKFRLKPMPFRTFGELPTLGLALEIYCPGCHAKVPVEIGDRLAPYRWGRVRFTCSRTRYNGMLCESRGHLYLNPVAPLDPDTKFVSMQCARCLSPWFAEEVQLKRFPWSSASIHTGRERYRCPGCGGQVRTTFHGKPERGRSTIGLAQHLLAPASSTATKQRPTIISEQFYPVPFF